jgi:FkbM family methyltransferase
MINALQRWIVRPYVRNELPRWGWVYKRFVESTSNDALWASIPPQTICDKMHGLEIELDLSKCLERLNYFLGRFYDLPTQLLLMKVLHTGDRFVDVGANIGMISLLGSHRVGAEGTVDSFEPNPACAERIRSMAICNKLTNIRLHNMALGGTAGTLPLRVPKHNSGEGTLAAAGSAEFRPKDSDVYEVAVEVGDEILARDPSPPVLIKIDVEGLEHQVLTGLRETLARYKPLVTTEVVASHCARAGTTPADLFGLMNSYGYASYAMNLCRRGFRRTLKVEPTKLPDESHDVLWVPTEGEARSRL